MQKMSACLWFNGNAKEAVDFYVSVFKDAKIILTSHYDIGAEDHGMRKGDVLAIYFEANGQKFIAINAGPEFKFNESVSFVVECDNQKEIDYYWDKLTIGGEISQCGWLKDKFGLSWQVTPTVLPKMLVDPDPKKRERVFSTFIQMKKFNIEELNQAYQG